MGEGEGEGGLRFLMGSDTRWPAEVLLAVCAVSPTRGMRGLPRVEVCHALYVMHETDYSRKLCSVDNHVSVGA